jgi:hypothetical protein
VVVSLSKSHLSALGENRFDAVHLAQDWNSVLGAMRWIPPSVCQAVGRTRTPNQRAGHSSHGATLQPGHSSVYSRESISSFRRSTSPHWSLPANSILYARDTVVNQSSLMIVELNLLEPSHFRHRSLTPPPHPKLSSSSSPIADHRITKIGNVFVGDFGPRARGRGSIAQIFAINPSRSSATIS